MLKQMNHKNPQNQKIDKKLLVYSDTNNPRTPVGLEE